MPSGTSGPPSGAGCPQREPRCARPRGSRIPRGTQTLPILEVVVQVIDLPLHAVWILDPELVLIRMAAVHPDLLAHRQPSGLDSGEVDRHGLGAVDLDADVVHRSLPAAPALGQG